MPEPVNIACHKARGNEATDGSKVAKEQIWKWRDYAGGPSAITSVLITDRGTGGSVSG